jgi:hypothetical protein
MATFVQAATKASQKAQQQLKEYGVFNDPTDPEVLGMACNLQWVVTAMDEAEYFHPGLEPSRIFGIDGRALQ